MTELFEYVEDALDTLSVPYAAGKYLTENDSLPDEFMTYYLVSSTPVQQADDAEELRGERVQVSIFNRDGLVELPDIEGAMLAQGFRFNRKFMLPFEESTGHFGLGLEFTRKEAK
jgi:hypothetical protein